MALLQCSFKSEVLKMEQTFNVILPQIPMADLEKRKQIEEDGFPTLYLLHGLSDDHSVWLRRTSIERYALNYGLAVVMPNVNRSFYADMKDGLPYYTYITQEVPILARTNFPLSVKRENNYIAGLSMGGYGAFMIALRNPELFSCAASLSGAVDLTPIFTYGEDDIKILFKQIFGTEEEYLKTDYDLIGLIKRQVKKGIKLPRLFQCCGTEDFLYPLNENFKAAAMKYQLELTYEEGPGTHEWGYWDTNIQRVLAWIFQEDRGQ